MLAEWKEITRPYIFSTRLKEKTENLHVLFVFVSSVVGNAPASAPRQSGHHVVERIR